MKMHIYELKITIYQANFHSIFRSSEALSIPQRINNQSIVCRREDSRVVGLVFLSERKLGRRIFA